MVAAKNGKDEAVRLLLNSVKGHEHATLIEAQNSLGRTALHIAAEFGHEDVVRVLLEQKGDPNKKANLDITPLLIATARGKLGVVKLLLAQEDEEGKPAIDIGAQDADGNTALHLAVRFGTEDLVGTKDMVRALLNRGCDPNEMDNKGVTPLMLAAQKGRAELLNLFFLLQGQLVRLDAQDKKGWSALHFAAKSGGKRAVETLLMQGAEPGLKIPEDGRTPFLIAAEEGNVAAAKLFFGRKDKDGKPVIDAQDKNGWSALHHAVEGKRRGFVNTLLMRGADPGLRITEYGLTPLLMAAEAGLPELVELFLGRKDKEGKLLIDAQDNQGFAALHYAVGNEDEDLVATLLNRGADPSLRATISGYTPLIRAVRKGQVKLIEPFLGRNDKEGKPVIDGQDNDGWSALHHAVSRGCGDVVATLLNRGADPNLGTTIGGFTPLALAVKDGKAAMVELLLQQKNQQGKPFVNVNAGSSGKWTALHYAATAGHKNITKILLDNGADPDMRTALGRTPLMLVAARGERNVLDSYFANTQGKFAAGINAQDASGRTALHYAAWIGSSDVIGALLQQGANPNGQTKNDVTPLMVAARLGNVEAINGLFGYQGESVVDVNAQDVDQQTALHVAVMRGHQGAVKALLNHGAEINRKDKNGFTALHHAVQNRQVDILETLLLHPGSEKLHTVYDAGGPLHALLPSLKKDESECSQLLDAFHRHLVEWESEKLRAALGQAPSFASTAEREIDRRKQEMQQEWNRLPFEARKIRILESWTLIYAQEPEIDPAHTVARKEQQRTRMRNTRLSSHTNLYLGKLLAKEEQRSKAPQNDSPDECVKDARFRLRLALEHALQGYEYLGHVQECAEQLLRVAPQEKAFTIGGVTWLAWELEELAANDRGALAEQVALAHDMAEGRKPHAHQGGVVLMSQGLLVEMQRRNAAREPRVRKEIAPGTLDRLASLTGKLPFSQVFHTGIYWEYEAAFRMCLNQLRDYLAKPSREKLDDLACLLQSEIAKTPVQDVIKHYEESPDPNAIAVLEDEIVERRELLEIKRIVQAIQLELELKTEIEALIDSRVFESEDEAWERMPLHRQDQDMVKALIDQKKCENEKEARRLLQELAHHETQFVKLVEELTAEPISQLQEEMSKALTPENRNLIRGLIENDIVSDRTAALEIFKDELSSERMDALIALGLFPSREEIAGFPRTPDFQELTKGLRRELEITDQARKQLLTRDKEELVEPLSQRQSTRIRHEYENAFRAFHESEDLLARLVEAGAFQSIDAAREKLSSGGTKSQSNIKKLTELKMVNGADQALDAIKGVERAKALVAELVEGKYFSSADMARAALKKSEGEKHVDQLIDQEITIVKKEIRETLDTLRKTEPKLLQLSGEGGLFRDRQHARRYLKEMQTRNWYWARSALREFDDWLKRRPDRTLSGLAAFGLRHTFSRSRPVQDKELKTNTHTALQTTWDYCANMADENVRRKLEKSFLHKLIDIGQDPMCSTVCVEKVISTPLYIDMTLRGKQPSLQMVKQSYEYLLPYLPSLDIDEIFDAALEGEKIKDGKGNLLDAEAALEFFLGVDKTLTRNWLEAEQQVKDWMEEKERQAQDPFQALFARDNKIREELRALGDKGDKQAEGSMERLRALDKDIRNLDSDLVEQYPNNTAIQPGDLPEDPEQALDMLRANINKVYTQLLKNKEESLYEKERKRRVETAKESRARLEAEPGVQTAREVKEQLAKRSLLDYLKRRGTTDNEDSVVPLVDKVVTR